MGAGEADHIAGSYVDTNGDVDPFQEAVGGAQAIAVVHRDRQHPGNRAGEGHCAAGPGAHRGACSHVEVEAVVAGPLLGAEPTRHGSINGPNEGGAAQRRHEKDG